MDKEDMISILNQHGIDVLHSIIDEAIDRSYNQGYNDGYEDGVFETGDRTNNLDTKLLS